jgi:hypothetical protein
MEFKRNQTSEHIHHVLRTICRFGSAALQLKPNSLAEFQISIPYLSIIAPTKNGSSKLPPPLAQM